MKAIPANRNYEEDNNVESHEKEKYPYLVLGWIILGTSGIGTLGRYLVLKYVEKYLGIPALQTLAIVCALSSVIMIGLELRWNGLPSFWGPFSWFSHLPSVIAFVLTGPITTIMLHAYLLIGAGDACAIYVCSGPLSTFLSWFVYDDQGATPAEVVSMLLCIMGVICIVRPPALFHFFFGDEINVDRGGQVVSSQGYVLAVASMVMSAITMVSQPAYVRHHGKLRSMILQDFSRTLVTGFVVFYTDSTGNVSQFERSIPWVVFILVAHRVSSLGWMYAATMIPISHQGVIRSFDKVWAYFLGVFIFHEKLHWLSIVGATEIWIALLFMGHSKAERQGKTALQRPESDHLKQNPEFNNETNYGSNYSASTGSDSPHESSTDDLGP